MAQHDTNLTNKHELQPLIVPTREEQKSHILSHSLQYPQECEEYRRINRRKLIEKE